MTAKKQRDPEEEIAKAENEIEKARAKLAALRRRLPVIDVDDYMLLGEAGQRVTLSALFGAKDELVLIHNMGRRCPYCTLWADGFNGVVQHLEDRASFVVVSPDPPEEQAEFAASRGWTFRMVSAHGTSFAKDLGFQTKDGGYKPGASSFQKRREGTIVRTSKTRFGPGDDFCAVWHLFDLLPRGRADWQPKLKY